MTTEPTDDQVRAGFDTCVYCGGTGWSMEPGHDPTCDEYVCAERCPVPVQSPCPECVADEMSMMLEAE